MNKDENQHGKLPVEGHDFAKHDEEQKKQPASQGEVAGQKDGDFSELEKSRMENPPDHREENGSDKDDVNSDTRINQSKGINNN
ncbi:MAG: hypothetical protein J7577_05465 [Sphingobacteriaceae bacterium]|nr:hypothetical protein [Sphingobacteriaceae bacterium]